MLARVLDNLTPTSQNAEFLVNPAYPNTVYQSNVGVDDSGRYLIAYTGVGFDNPSGVNARSYSAAGGAASNPFSATTPPGYSSEYPAVSANSSGRFVVGWTEYLGCDGSGAGSCSRV